MVITVLKNVGRFERGFTGLCRILNELQELSEAFQVRAFKEVSAGLWTKLILRLIGSQARFTLYGSPVPVVRAHQLATRIEEFKIEEVKQRLDR